MQLYQTTFLFARALKLTSLVSLAPTGALTTCSGTATPAILPYLVTLKHNNASQQLALTQQPYGTNQGVLARASHVTNRESPPKAKYTQTMDVRQYSVDQTASKTDLIRFMSSRSSGDHDGKHNSPFSTVGGAYVS